MGHLSLKVCIKNQAMFQGKTLRSVSPEICSEISILRKSAGRWLDHHKNCTMLQFFEKARSYT